MTESEISLLNISNYKVCSYFSRSLRTGGGVLILAYKDIQCKNISIPAIKTISVEKEFESCLSEITVGIFTFVLASLYRTLQYRFIQPFLDKLELLLDKLCKNLIM